MLSIIKRLDPDDHYDGANHIEFIVTHDTGNYTDSDEGNANYFVSGTRNASAHYFVDDDSITQVVEDKDGAFHCGDGYGKYGITNRNSLSIEMCRVNGTVTTTTENNTIELIKYLMRKYNISADKVVRHYDVSRKICPSSFSDNSWARWDAFKAKLVGVSAPEQTTSKESLGIYAQLQLELNRQGFGKLVVDNIPGPKTLAACPLLKYGTQGDITRWVQHQIGVSADDIFGTNTLIAVQKFQKSNGLQPDGIVGQNTWKKLLGL